MSISFPPLPEPDVSWVDGVDQWGYDDYSHAYSADAMHAHAAAVSAAARDAEIERLTAERDAAFAMSRCQCATDEACAELAKLRQYLDAAQRRASALGDVVAGLREDAERYRYLRHISRQECLVLDGPEAGVWCDCENEHGDLVLLTEGDLDAAIDAALAVRKGTT